MAENIANRNLVLCSREKAKKLALKHKMIGIDTKETVAYILREVLENIKNIAGGKDNGIIVADVQDGSKVLKGINRSSGWVEYETRIAVKRSNKINIGDNVAFSKVFVAIDIKIREYKIDKLLHGESELTIADVAMSPARIEAINMYRGSKVDTYARINLIRIKDILEYIRSESISIMIDRAIRVAECTVSEMLQVYRDKKTTLTRNDFKVLREEIQNNIKKQVGIGDWYSDK